MLEEVSGLVPRPGYLDRLDLKGQPTGVASGEAGGPSAAGAAAETDITPR